MQGRDRWAPGEHVLVRHVARGRVVMALPSIVVADREDALATWIAPGTPIVYPEGLAGGRLLPVEDWRLAPRPWRGGGVLDVWPTGRPHMIRHFWGEDGAFRGWYVNLQDPLARRGNVLDTMDHQLDLWIEPGGAVEWQDEDHLEQAVELGLLSAKQAAGVRAEAERVVAKWPFPTGWEGFSPEPDWAVPELPAAWEEL